VITTLGKSQSGCAAGVLLTADQNLEHQQNLRALLIAVAILVAASNRIESLRPLAPELLRVLPTLKRGDLIRVTV
jgi:hypothetical protein